MKKVLVAGDSFFFPDKSFPGEHFSEMLGPDVLVTNVSGCGFSNTAIFGQILYALMQDTFDYCIIGFTSALRLPIRGQTDFSFSPMHIQWRSTSFGNLSPKERHIADQFLAITADEPYMISDLAMVELILQILKEKDIRVAWMYGGLLQVRDAYKDDSFHATSVLINRIASKYNSQLIDLDYWAYPTLVAKPAYHINDVKYQRDMATRVAKKLGL